MKSVDADARRILREEYWERAVVENHDLIAEVGIEKVKQVFDLWFDGGLPKDCDWEEAVQIVEQRNRAGVVNLDDFRRR